MHGRPLDQAERDLIVTLRADGKKLREIAAALDRPPGTVSRVISDAILDGRLERRATREAPRAMRHYDRG